MLVDIFLAVLTIALCVVLVLFAARFYFENVRR